jgi:SAM-dependent methyltransferase
LHEPAHNAISLVDEFARDGDPVRPIRQEIAIVQQQLAARDRDVAALKKWLAGREIAVLGQQIATEYNVSGLLDSEDHMLGHFIRANGIKKGIQIYFRGGKADAEKLLELMKLFGMNEEDSRILEFASGYGRITRHFTKRCNVTASDIHPAAVEMIQSRLNTPAYVSSHAPHELAIPGQYDFVFAISLFSHLPDATFAPWIAALLSLTKPGGHLMFTTHGPKGAQTFPELPPPGPDGIGFIPLSEQTDLDGHRYGTTTVTPEYVRQKIVSVGGELVSYDEIEWWGFQDQWIVRRPQSTSIRYAI